MSSKKTDNVGEVNFKVLKISKANKPGHAVAEIQFHSSPKVFTYVRRTYYDDSAIVIDGCVIYFNQNWEVIKIERQYETTGKKRFKTGRKSKPQNDNPAKPLSKKLKAEIEITDDEIEVDENSNEQNAITIENDEYIFDSDELIKHEKYDLIKACIENKIPVFLSGPAGSGKNHTLEQIAVDMGMNFYFSNSIQQEYKLTGFIDAGGKFHETEFYKACTDDKPCIFFLDEIDASIPEVLVLLNAAIANGYFEFPTGKVYLSNVRFVAAGNTVGSGADELYTGRMVIDQATLDRFAIIDFDYDRKIELFIAKGNKDLVDFVRALRDDANRKGIRATFSYRAIQMIVKLEKSKVELSTAVKISIVKGLDAGTLKTLYPAGQTKYHDALRKVQRESSIV